MAAIVQAIVAATATAAAAAGTAAGIAAVAAAAAATARSCRSLPSHRQHVQGQVVTHPQQRQLNTRITLVGRRNKTYKHVAYRQHVQGQVAVLQLAQQLKGQLLLKLAQRVLVGPQPKLKGLCGRFGRWTGWPQSINRQVSTDGRRRLAPPPKQPTRFLLLCTPAGPAHLAHCEAQLGGRRPALAQANLKEGACDAGRVLCGGEEAGRSKCV